MNNKVKWTKNRAATRLIGMLRQLVVNEYDGSKLYGSYPSLDGINSVESLKWLMHQYGKESEIKLLEEFIEGKADTVALPVMSSVHDFLHKQDAAWYNSQEAFTK